jgi:hypothetical protein
VPDYSRQDLSRFRDNLEIHCGNRVTPRKLGAAATNLANNAVHDIVLIRRLGLIGDGALDRPDRMVGAATSPIRPAGPLRFEPVL